MMADRISQTSDRRRRREGESPRIAAEPQAMPRARPSSNQPPYAAELSSSGSSSSSYIDISRTFPAYRPRGFGAIRTFFTAPSERRRLRRRRSRRLLRLSNSSSSSINSDLAYGTGFLKKRGGSRRHSASSRRERRHGEPSGNNPSRIGTDAEILAMGAGLAALARKQNKQDLREAKKPTVSSSKAQDSGSWRETETMRGFASSKLPHDHSDDESWESASDGEYSSSSVDSNLAFGHEDADKSWGWGAPSLKRRSTIVDPALFGPQNSLNGALEQPVGFQPVNPDFSVDPPTLADLDAQKRDSRNFNVTMNNANNAQSSGSSNVHSLQYVYPVPTSDPTRFDAARGSVPSDAAQIHRFPSRPDPVPIQQPQPVAPVFQRVYDPNYTTQSEPIQHRSEPSPRLRNSSLAGAALAGVAATVAGAAIISDRRESRSERDRKGKRREDDRKSDRGKDTNVSFRDDDREERRERRREDERRYPEEGRDERRDRRRREDQDYPQESREERRTRKKLEEREIEASRHREHRRIELYDEPLVEAQAYERGSRAEARREERRESLRDDRSSQSVVAHEAIDPFQFQVADDAFPTPDFAQPPVKVITVDREPAFVRERSSSIKDTGRDNYGSRRHEDGADHALQKRDMNSISHEIEESTAPIAIGAITAAVAAVNAEERRHQRRPSRDRKDRRKAYEPTTQEERDEVQDKVDKMYREMILAQKIASETSDVEEPPISRIPTPPGYHKPEKGPFDAPDADFKLDKIMTPVEFKGFTPVVDRVYPSDRDFDGDRRASERYLVQRPMLTLVQPTPIPTPVATPSPSRQRPNSEPNQVSREVEDSAESPTISDIVIGPRGNLIRSQSAPGTPKGVTWGENETKHFMVESPGEVKEDPFEAAVVAQEVSSEAGKRPSRPDRRSSDSQAMVADPKQSTGWGTIAGAAIGAGAGVTVATKSSSASEKAKSSAPEQPAEAFEYRGIVVEPESPQHTTRDQSPPAVGPKPIISSFTNRDQHIPGSYEDDLDFTATLAAGLQDSGFDPNIVIEDPSYRRRTSPPGSNHATYRTPFAETVSDLGTIALDSPSHEDAPHMRGIILGEIPETPGDEDAVQVYPTKLSKKEQKTRDKATKRQSLDNVNEFRKQEAFTTPQVEDPDIHIEAVPSSKKDQKKSKKSKRVSLGYDDLGEDAPGVVVPVNHFDDLRQLDQSRGVDEDDSWSTPKRTSKVYDDHQELSRRDPANIPLPVASETGHGSYEGKPSREKTTSRHSSRHDSPPGRDPAEIPLPAASDASRDDYDEPRLSRKSSKRDSTISRRDSQSIDSRSSRSRLDDDDNDSKASRKEKKEKSKDKDKDREKRSSGGFFGLFGSSTSSKADTERSKSRSSDHRDNSVDSKSKSKMSKQSSLADGSDIYGSIGSQSITDLSQLSKVSSNGQAEKDELNNVERRRKRSSTKSYSNGNRAALNENESGSKEESFLAKAGTLGAGAGIVGAAVALAAQRLQNNAAVAAEKQHTSPKGLEEETFRSKSFEEQEPQIQQEVLELKALDSQKQELTSSTQLLFVEPTRPVETEQSPFNHDSSRLQVQDFVGERSGDVADAGGLLQDEAVAKDENRHSSADLQKSLTSKQSMAATSPSSIEDEEHLLDPEIRERQFRPSIDPLYGDLLALPPSSPSTPVDETPEHLPSLPESRPNSPKNDLLRQRERLTISTRRTDQQTPMKSPSSTAVPLNFLRRDRSNPSSPRVARGSFSTPPPITSPESAMSIRSQGKRTSWGTSKEIQPLFLLDQNRRGSLTQTGDINRQHSMPEADAFPVGEARRSSIVSIVAAVEKSVPSINVSDLPPLPHSQPNSPIVHLKSSEFQADVSADDQIALSRDSSISLTQKGTEGVAEDYKPSGETLLADPFPVNVDTKDRSSFLFQQTPPRDSATATPEDTPVKRFPSQGEPDAAYSVTLKRQATLELLEGSEAQNISKMMPEAVEGPEASLSTKASPREVADDGTVEEVSVTESKRDKRKDKKNKKNKKSYSSVHSDFVSAPTEDPFSDKLPNICKDDQYSLMQDEVPLEEQCSKGASVSAQSSGFSDVKGFNEMRKNKGTSHLTTEDDTTTSTFGKAATAVATGGIVTAAATTAIIATANKQPEDYSFEAFTEIPEVKALEIQSPPTKDLYGEQVGAFIAPKKSKKGKENNRKRSVLDDWDTAEPATSKSPPALAAPTPSVEQSVRNNSQETQIRRASETGDVDAISGALFAHTDVIPSFQSIEAGQESDSQSDLKTLTDTLTEEPDVDWTPPVKLSKKDKKKKAKSLSWVDDIPAVMSPIESGREDETTVPISSITSPSKRSEEQHIQQAFIKRENGEEDSKSTGPDTKNVVEKESEASWVPSLSRNDKKKKARSLQSWDDIPAVVTSNEYGHENDSDPFSKETDLAKPADPWESSGFFTPKKKGKKEKKKAALSPWEDDEPSSTDAIVEVHTAADPVQFPADKPVQPQQTRSDQTHVSESPADINSTEDSLSDWAMSKKSKKDKQNKRTSLPWEEQEYQPIQRMVELTSIPQPRHYLTATPDILSDMTVTAEALNTVEQPGEDWSAPKMTKKVKKDKKNQTSNRSPVSWEDEQNLPQQPALEPVAYTEVLQVNAIDTKSATEATNDDGVLKISAQPEEDSYAPNISKKDRKGNKNKNKYRSSVSRDDDESHRMKSAPESAPLMLLGQEIHEQNAVTSSFETLKTMPNLENADDVYHTPEKIKKDKEDEKKNKSSISCDEPSQSEQPGAVESPPTVILDAAKSAAVQGATENLKTTKIAQASDELEEWSTPKKSKKDKKKGRTSRSFENELPSVPDVLNELAPDESTSIVEAQSIGLASEPPTQVHVPGEEDEHTTKFVPVQENKEKESASQDLVEHQSVNKSPLEEPTTVPLPEDTNVIDITSDQPSFEEEQQQSEQNFKSIVDGHLDIQASSSGCPELPFAKGEDAKLGDCMDLPKVEPQTAWKFGADNKGIAEFPTTEAPGEAEAAIEPPTSGEANKSISAEPQTGTIEAPTKRKLSKKDKKKARQASFAWGQDDEPTVEPVEPIIEPEQVHPSSSKKGKKSKGKRVSLAWNVDDDGVADMVKSEEPQAEKQESRKSKLIETPTDEEVWTPTTSYKKEKDKTKNREVFSGDNSTTAVPEAEIVAQSSSPAVTLTGSDDAELQAHRPIGSQPQDVTLPISNYKDRGQSSLVEIVPQDIASTASDSADLVPAHNLPQDLPLPVSDEEDLVDAPRREVPADVALVRPINETPVPKKLSQPSIQMLTPPTIASTGASSPSPAHMLPQDFTVPAVDDADLAELPDLSSLQQATYSISEMATVETPKSASVLPREVARSEKIDENLMTQRQDSTEARALQAWLSPSSAQPFQTASSDFSNAEYFPSATTLHSPLQVTPANVDEKRGYFPSAGAMLPFAAIGAAYDLKSGSDAGQQTLKDSESSPFAERSSKEVSAAPVPESQTLVHGSEGEVKPALVDDNQKAEDPASIVFRDRVSSFSTTEEDQSHHPSRNVIASHITNPDVVHDDDLSRTVPEESAVSELNSQTNFALPKGVTEEQLQVARQLKLDIENAGKTNKKGKKRGLLRTTAADDFISSSSPSRDLDLTKVTKDIAEPVQKSSSSIVVVTPDGLQGGYTADQIRQAQELQLEFASASSKKSKKDKKRQSLHRIVTEENFLASTLDELSQNNFETDSPVGLVKNDEPESDTSSSSEKKPKQGEKDKGCSVAPAGAEIPLSLEVIEPPSSSLPVGTTDSPISAGGSDDLFITTATKKSKKDKKGKKAKNVLDWADESSSADVSSTAEAAAIALPETPIRPEGSGNFFSLSKKDKKQSKRAKALSDWEVESESTEYPSTTEPAAIALPPTPRVSETSEEYLPVSKKDKKKSKKAKNEIDWATEASLADIAPTVGAESIALPETPKSFEAADDFFLSMENDKNKDKGDKIASDWVSVTNNEDIIATSAAAIPLPLTPVVPDSSDDFLFSSKKEKKSKKTKNAVDWTSNIDDADNISSNAAAATAFPETSALPESSDDLNLTTRKDKQDKQYKHHDDVPDWTSKVTTPKMPGPIVTAAVTLLETPSVPDTFDESTFLPPKSKRSKKDSKRKIIDRRTSNGEDLFDDPALWESPKPLPFEDTKDHHVIPKLCDVPSVSTLEPAAEQEDVNLPLVEHKLTSKPETLTEPANSGLKTVEKDVTLMPEPRLVSEVTSMTPVENTSPLTLEPTLEPEQSQTERVKESSPPEHINQPLQSNEPELPDAQADEPRLNRRVVDVVYHEAIAAPSRSAPDQIPINVLPSESRFEEVGIPEEWATKPLKKGKKAKRDDPLERDTPHSPSEATKSTFPQNASRLPPVLEIDTKAPRTEGLHRTPSIHRSKSPRSARSYISEQELVPVCEGVDVRSHLKSEEVPTVIVDTGYGPQARRPPALKLMRSSDDFNRDSGFISDSPSLRSRGFVSTEVSRDSGVHMREWSPTPSEREKQAMPSTAGCIIRQASWEPNDDRGSVETGPKSRPPRPLTPKYHANAAIPLGTVAAASASLAAAAAASRTQKLSPDFEAKRSVSFDNGRLRSPELSKVRPGSASSNRSATPPLRRMDRRVSGDLRSLGQRSLSNLAKDAKDDALSPATSIANDSNPTANEGRARAKDMADVYDGFGEGHIRTPASPERPQSMRRRQSRHVLDLETKLEQVIEENRMLAEAKSQAESSLAASQKTTNALADREAELDSLKVTLDWLHKEVERLKEVNDGLQSANITLENQQNNRYSMLQAEHHSATQELWETREAHESLSTGMEGIVRNQVANATVEKDQEIARLRGELESAQATIRSMQHQILSAKANDSSFLTVRDEDYFDAQCQQLCQNVQQWVLRFSKFSDMRACRLTSEINNDKTIDRLDNAILDGSDVDQYLSDRVRRRDVFMSMTMTMIWEFVFTRYLFGMDREQRQKLKSLEKTLLEVGPPAAVHHWRATTLTLLAKREPFEKQRDQDTEAVVQAIFGVLSEILPPPSQLEDQIQDQLRRVMRTAVELSIEMRTQRAEYMMLPPLQPEYDANGDLARQVSFNAALMNERSGDTMSNEDLEAQAAVVRVVLFPLVVKKGDDAGVGTEEIVVCPAQVLVAKPKRNTRVGSAASAMSVAGNSKMSLQSTIPEGMI